MSSIIKEIIYEFFTYNEIVHSYKAMQWQKAMPEEFNPFIKNYTWDIIHVPKNQKVFKEK